ncbi:MAG: hypothetical protein ACTHU0_27100 [Kofleriaceae bacterium]
MARISKKVREEAALICAIAASTPFLYDQIAYQLPTATIAGWLGASDDAFELALEARVRTAGDGCSYTAVGDAEAEALLRTGWTP